MHCRLRSFLLLQSCPEDGSPTQQFYSACSQLPNRPPPASTPNWHSAPCFTYFLVLNQNDQMRSKPFAHLGTGLANDKRSAT